MGHTLSRRDFLKASAALATALSLPAWFPAAQPALARSNQVGKIAPSLSAVNSQLPTNQPIADIAAGWDGTQWALDTIGVAHLYDPLAQTWQPFGRGVDAATKIGDTFYLFRDDEVALYHLQQGLVSLQTIGTLWPQLPATFQGSLDGAFANGQTIYLCRSGRFVSADLSSSPVTFSQPIPLATWYAWPTTAPWEQGVVGKAGTWIDSNLPATLFFPAQSPPQTFVLAFLVQGGAANLNPIAEVGNTIPPAASQIVDLLAAGDFDAYITQTDGPRIPNEHWVFQGPILWTQTNTDQNTGAVTPIALASWVPAWFPQLAQAPRGRVGNLWSLTPGGAVLYHDGIAWQTAPAISGATVISLDVGEDAIPFAIATGGSGAALYPFDPATMSWQQPVALGAITPKQVAAGDATRVYVLDTGGAVSKLENNSFVPVGTLPAGITQLTANHDGTLWHCDGSSPNAFRFISERPYQATVPVPNVTSVQRVASTAYGNAFMLVQQAGASQIYTYDSPFLFKTSPSFVPLANGRVLQNPQVTPGGGRCFVNVGSGIVALDSRTGEELWAQSLPNQGQCASIIYDPPHQLLYATDNAHMLFAIDAATGAERWSYQVIGTVGQPVLSGGGLCVLGQMDAGVNAYWFNTAAALNQAANNQPVTPVWQQEVGNGIPVLSAVYVDAGYVYLLLVLTDIMSTAEGVVRLNAADGSAPTVLYTYGLAGEGGNGDWNGNLAAVFGRQTIAGAHNQILFSNTSDGVQAFPLLPTGAAVPINAPPANGFTEGVACYNDAVYVCGTNGVLYTLDLSQPLNSGSTFQPVPQQAPISGGSFGAGPVVASTAAGALIAFSMSAGGKNSVCLYDPADGNLLQLDTDQMLATQLIADDDGILYAAGLDPANPSDPFGQVYAIRIDEILQQERAFIVESELMQDFDEPSAGQLAATARYQTHVTIVDALKAPRPFQAVKVWADTDKATSVLIDGVAYTIDATTPAVVQTDATGSLTIVSDATDLSTTALKLWAGFMNFYERIVVYPDREFHSRLTTTHADAASTNPDPTRINLATATTYDVNNLTNPPTLFAQNEQAQAGAAAGAVKQLTTAVGYPSGVTTNGRQPARAAAPPANSYLAYSDLPGAAYGPVNTPANRVVSALAVAGFTGFTYDGTSVTPLSVVDAANAIDALQGQALAAPGSFWTALGELWDKIKSGAAKIGQIVVSIGKDIYAGLKYIEAGVEKVLRQVLHDIEDVAIIIGSVFIQLGKLLVDVAEALSLIFHLKEVLATADAIKGVFTTMTTNLAAAIAGAATTVTTFFADAETTIDDAFAKITAKLGGAAAAAPAIPAAGGIGGLQGMGATPHTVFTVGPKSSSQSSSQAVPAMWGVHKLRQKYPQGTSQPSGALLPSSGSDPLTQFLQSFFTDAGNTTQVGQFKDSYHTQIRFGSAKEFFASLLVTLLDALQALVDKVLTLLGSLVDGVIDNASAIAGLLGAEGNVQIPVISAIWHALTGNTLTFLDLIAFVVAIPVTLVYRIVEGSYPSFQLLAAGAAQTASTVLARVQGISSAIANVLAGFFNAIFDSISIAGGEQTLLSTIINVIVSIDLASNLVIGDVLTPEVWVVVASIISLLMLVLNSIPGLPSEIPSITGVALSPLLLVAYWQTYAKSQESATDALGLSANVVGALPAIVNPIKFAPLTTPAPLVAPIADLVCGLASAGLTLGATIAGWDASAPPTALPETEEPATGSHRIFMPAILGGS